MSFFMRSVSLTADSSVMVFSFSASSLSFSDTASVTASFLSASNCAILRVSSPISWSFLARVSWMAMVFWDSASWSLAFSLSISISLSEMTSFRSFEASSLAMFTAFSLSSFISS